jgi:hypothetical protein
LVDLARGFFMIAILWRERWWKFGKFHVLVLDRFLALFEHLFDALWEFYWTSLSTFLILLNTLKHLFLKVKHFLTTFSAHSSSFFLLSLSTL